MVGIDDVLNKLTTVIDPDLKKDIVSMGMIKDLELNSGNLKFTLELTTPACPFNEEIEQDVRKAIDELDGIDNFDMKVTAKVMEGRDLAADEAMATVKNIIAVASGKGGVGKSTVSLNLALALSSTGAKVGLLDADIYGPSIPKMFNINEKPQSDGKSLSPIVKYDIQCMSIGFLADQQTPMIWRGPMVTSAIKTFTQKVLWKDLDFIIVDMPPGTGDTQLTFSQEIKMDGAIIISTPQEVALLDVKRGIKMFDKLGVKILGLVDNMSYFIGDDGKKYKIFGEGGVKKTAEEFNKEFLGEIPINPEVGKFGDLGKPIVEANPDHEISKIYLEFANKIKSTYL